MKLEAQEAIIRILYQWHNLSVYAGDKERIFDITEKIVEALINYEEITEEAELMWLRGVRKGIK